MEWQFAIGIACWCFIAGMIIGERVAKRDNRRALMLDEIFTQAVKDNRQFRKFAGLQCRAYATVLDEGGQVWCITIEREGA